MLGLSAPFDSGRLRGDRGQTVILLALLLPVVVAFLGFVVVVGQVANARRDLQNDADRAALAAALDLPSAATAAAAGNEWLRRNGIDTTDADITITITTPFRGNPNQVYVRVERPVDTTFGLGRRVSASAVAEKITGGGGQYAIFAMEESCSAPDPLEISGSNVAIAGVVHSNSELKINGSDNIFDGGTTYHCSLDLSGSGNTFDPAPLDLDDTLPPPLDMAFSDFSCDRTWSSDVNLGSESGIWIDATTLEPGTYCSDGNLQLSGSDITGEVTLVARGELQVSGSNFTLSPAPDDPTGVLFFSEASSSSALDLSGSGGSWEGIIHAPNGTAKMQGSSNLSLTGSIIAGRVKVSGSNFSMTASSEYSAGVAFIFLVR